MMSNRNQSIIWNKDEIRILQDQETSDEVDMSVPESMDLFRQDENKDIVIIPTDDAGGPSTEKTIPSEVLNFWIWFENISEIVNGKC